VDRYFAALQERDWHYCEEASLDFDYGEALREEYQEMLAQEEAAHHEIEKAKALIAQLRGMTASPAFSQENIAEFFERFQVSFFPTSSDVKDRISAIERALVFDEAAVWTAPASKCVEEQVASFRHSAQVERLLLQILDCAAAYNRCDQGHRFWGEVVATSS
jgi:hypothetical protein